MALWSSAPVERDDEWEKMKSGSVKEERGFSLSTLQHFIFSTL